ncbi:MAG: hypothetical protein ACOX2O_09520 [Bdellovibrionota bacterium]|jgi:hypothetical protein
MGTDSKTIDFSDMELDLSGLPEESIADTLTLLLKSGRYLTTRPEIQNGVLYINSEDFITFLGFVDPALISELELQRLKTRAKFEYKRLLFNAVIPKHRYHYKWCLTALNTLEVGRSLTVVEDEKVAASELSQKIKTFKLKE